MKKGIMVSIILLLICFSPWTKTLIQSNYLLGFLYLAFSLLLCDLVIINRSKTIKWIEIIVYFLFILYITLSFFNTSLVTPSNFDINIMDTRKNYFSNRQRLLAEKRFTLIINKYRRRVFDNLSLNQYFFGGKPRLRGHAIDFNKHYPPLLLVFYLGIFFLIKNLNSKNNIKCKYYFFTLLLTLLLSGFVDQNKVISQGIMFPAINSIIIYGIIKTSENNY